jgi:hypothetical protein
MLAKLFKTLFGDNYQTNLERFVNSKRPQSSAEVEFWVRHYDQTRYRSM